MKNRRIIWIVWISMICTMTLLLCIPSANTEETVTVAPPYMEYLEYSPDRVISYMDINDVLSTRDQNCLWTEELCSEWEQYVFFTEKSFTCEDYQLLGYNGSMTYYFDNNGKLCYSQFLIDIYNTAEAYDSLKAVLTAKYGESYYSKSVKNDGEPDSHDEKKVYYVITPNGNDMNFYREWEFISIFLDADRNKLYVYQFGWGIDPLPEGTGLCSMDILYEE